MTGLQTCTQNLREQDRDLVTNIYVEKQEVVSENEGHRIRVRYGFPGRKSLFTNCPYLVPAPLTGMKHLEIKN